MQGQIFDLEVPISVYQLHLKGTEMPRCIQYSSSLVTLSGPDGFRNREDK